MYVLLLHRASTDISLSVLSDIIQNKFSKGKSEVQWTLVTTTAFVPKDVAIKMNLLL